MKSIGTPTRWLWALMLCSAGAVAQDIRFDDLQRTGPGLVRSVTIPGTGKEGRQYIDDFNRTDSSREEAARERARAYASSSGGSSSSSGGGSGAQYACTFTCYAINSGVFSNKAQGRGSAVVNASSSGDAKDVVSKNLKTLCPKGSTYVGNVVWGAESISCSKK